MHKMMDDVIIGIDNDISRKTMKNFSEMLMGDIEISFMLHLMEETLLHNERALV
jgi:hypothetical protein